MTRTGSMLAALLLCGAGSLTAQSLESGTWTGTIAPPGAPPFDATYEVTTHGDSLAITLHFPQAGSFSFRDIAVHEDRIEFSWTAGTTDLACKLMKREDGAYEGDCVDEDGETGQLVMVPPAEGSS